MVYNEGQRTGMQHLWTSNIQNQNQAKGSRIKIMKQTLYTKTRNTQLVFNTILKAQVDFALKQ